MEGLTNVLAGQDLPDILKGESESGEKDAIRRMLEGDGKKGKDSLGDKAKTLDDAEFGRLLMEAAEQEGQPHPPENVDEYNEWFDKVTRRMTDNAMEEGYLRGKDADGNVYETIRPQPHFVIKTRNERFKIFINVCSSEHVKEPHPFGEEEEGGDIKWRVPLSIGPGREERDKTGSLCRVYDVVYNTETLARSLEEADFKTLIISLAVQYLKQKSEPNLGETYTLPKMRCKGEPDYQRVRVDKAQEVENKLGDLNVPGSKGTVTRANPMGGPLIQEIDSAPKKKVDLQPKEEPEVKASTKPRSESTTSEPGLKKKVSFREQLEDFEKPKPPLPHTNGSGPTPTPAAPTPAPTPAPAAATPAPVQRLEPTATTKPPPAVGELEWNIVCQGSYDWASQGISPSEEDETPEAMICEVKLPESIEMKDVGTDAQKKVLDITSMETGKTLLSIPLPYMGDEDNCKAKFFKKRRVLQITVPVDGQAQEKQLHAEKVRLKREAEYAAMLDVGAREEAERAKAEQRRVFAEQMALRREKELKEEDIAREEELERQKKEERQKQIKAEGEKALKRAEESIKAAAEKRRAALGIDERPTEEVKGETSDEKGYQSTSYGNTPKRMKDLFGVEFKNRYVFALDTNV